MIRRFVVTPVRRFFALEAAPGILLVAATVIALLWVNVGSEASYASVWSSHLDIGRPTGLGQMDLHEFVNDVLMAVFFFVVGLEIKVEWIQGSLRDRRFARLPIMAALGGMVVPALLYYAITHGTPGEHGWGIPMATDIAFVVGVMALLGSRVPHPVKVFLLTLAIVDDLGAIVVIAGFYTDGLDAAWLGVMAACVAAIVLARVVGVWRLWLHLIIGCVLWYATWQSGVHATIAGVLVAFLMPMYVHGPERVWSPVRLLFERLRGWSDFLIVPVFALANAGVVLAGETDAAGTRVAAGIVVGLVVGKCVGVAGASWGTVRAGIAKLPEGVSWRHMLGAGMLAGIGFTMSLFITELAFDGPGEVELLDAAKRAILVGSVIAALLGTLTFRSAVRERGSDQPVDP